MKFEKVWGKILEHQNEIFYTKSGLELKYKVVDDKLYHNRTNPEIYKSEFKRAYKKFPIKYPSDIKNLVRGSAYIFSILMDDRILGKDKGGV